MSNLQPSRLAIGTPPIPYSNTGKHFLTINSHFITSLISLVFNKHHKLPC